MNIAKIVHFVCAIWICECIYDVNMNVNDDSINSYQDIIVHLKRSWLCSQLANPENAPCFAGPYHWEMAMELSIIILDPYIDDTLLHQKGNLWRKKRKTTSSYDSSLKRTLYILFRNCVAIWWHRTDHENCNVLFVFSNALEISKALRVPSYMYVKTVSNLVFYVFSEWNIEDNWQKKEYFQTCTGIYCTTSTFPNRYIGYMLF